MVKVTNQFWEDQQGISKATPIERWQWGYLSNTCDSLVGDHLYNHSFTKVDNSVSSMKLVHEWQAIRMPLNINDFHTDNYGKRGNLEKSGLRFSRKTLFPS